MSRKRKYQKTQGYYVYSHSIDCVVYYGVSKQQPCRRWVKALYKGKALEPYLDRWDEMEHIIIKDGMSKEQAFALEDWYIQNTPNCINKNRSGLICSDINEYMKEYQKQYYQENKEEIKEYQKQYYQEHKEEIKEYMKQYQKEHREELKEYRKQYDKQRNATTKRKEYMKQYYQEHKKIEKK